MNETYKKWMNEWRGQVKSIFNLDVLNLSNDEIDYCFLSSPQRAKRVLTDEQFDCYLTMWKEQF